MTVRLNFDSLANAAAVVVQVFENPSSAVVSFVNVLLVPARFHVWLEFVAFVMLNVTQPTVSGAETMTSLEPLIISLLCGEIIIVAPSPPVTRVIVSFVSLTLPAVSLAWTTTVFTPLPPVNAQTFEFVQASKPPNTRFSLANLQSLTPIASENVMFRFTKALVVFMSLLLATIATYGTALSSVTLVRTVQLLPRVSKTCATMLLLPSLWLLRLLML